MYDQGTNESTGEARPYQHSIFDQMAPATAGICAILAIGLAGWYLVSTSTANKKKTELDSQSSALTASITEADKLTEGTGPMTVRKRTQSLVGVVKQYKQILDSRQAMDKVLPVLAAETLKGVTLSSFAIDDKQVIRADGFAVLTTIGSNVYTPSDMITRQLLAYRAAILPGTDSTTTSTTATTSPVAPATSTSTPAVSPSPTTAPQTTTTVPTGTKVFTDVALVNMGAPGIDESATVNKFSFSMTLNPEVLKVTPPVVAPSPSSSTTTGTTTGGSGLTPSTSPATTPSSGATP